MKRRIGILTSGGDCPGLNAVIRGFAKYVFTNIKDAELIGISEGYLGLIEKEARRLERENEDKLRRMERSYTAIFALFTVIVFALAGGLILSLAGMRASYAYGSIEDLRTALLIIGAFFLTVLSIIIKLLSTLVPPMKEKEKRTIPARILSAIKQPITIAMLFLILGLVSGDASIKDSSVSSSRMQSALSNVIPIAEDVIIDL